MQIKPNDNTSISAGKKTPENKEVVELVQTKGELVVFLYGNINQPLKLVRRPKSEFQAFPASDADAQILEKLWTTKRGQIIPVTLIGE